MYRVLIVEDQPAQLLALQKILEFYNENFEIKTSSDYDTAYHIVTGSTIFDLFLLDIKFQEQDWENYSGLTLGHFIRSMHCYQYTPIVFITSIPEKIYEALNDTHCYHYILKPYTATDITQLLNDILHSPLVKDPSFSFTEFWGGQLSIPEKSILYFCPGMYRRIQIVTINGIFQTTEYTLSQLENLLHHGFVRCHRKYLVNICHITSYDCTRKTLSLSNQEIPVGRNYKSSVENAIRGIL